jgi:hypothetical protein
MTLKTCILLFGLILLTVLPLRAQDSRQDVFTQPDVYPSPLIGKDSLVRFMEDRISNGDTIGRKYFIRTSGIMLLINADGILDSAYVINHMVCPLHRELLKHLEEVRWSPARRNGQPIRFNHDIHYALSFTKSVLKKYRCR